MQGGHPRAGGLRESEPVMARERGRENLCLAETGLGHRSRMCRSDGECVSDVCNCFPVIGGSDRADGLHMVYHEFNQAI